MAGIEAVAFGFLVVVVAMLLIANAWAVVDAKMAVSAAAREAARAYVESPAEVDPLARADAAARAAMEGVGRDPTRLEITMERGSFERCARVRFRAAYSVPALGLPWIGGSAGTYRVVGTHSEVVDPYRSGLAAGSGRCEP